VRPHDPIGLVGQVLDGQFHVDAYVGEGGFSTVYKGTSVGLNEPIAVKCLKLPPSLGSALVETFVKRFRDESRIHYKLSQGNLHIARSIASGTTIAPATGALVPYTVLEWLEGRSLADDLADRRQRGMTGRSLPEVVKLLDSAVDAIAYAHSQGVVHRDLNPGNLFLARTPSGIKLKVLDFGVAKILADSALATGHAARTMGNVRMFAPAYGAPEQFDENVGPIGPWTDVYAVALVTLEALRDRTVMDGEHLGEFAMKALDPAHRPTPRALGIAVGDDVEAVLARAVALEPMDRPGDAGELWGMLKHAMGVDAQPVQPGRAPAAPSLARGYRSTLRIPGGAGAGPGRPDGAAALGPSLAAALSPVPAGMTPRSTKPMAASSQPPAPRASDPSTGTLPPSALPASALPVNALPPSALPASALPVNALPPSALPASALPTVPGPPRSRPPVAWLIVLAVLVLGGLAMGAWQWVVHAHHAALAAAPSRRG
jgi:eukaryotic-like serine/threonine-protein kinase